MNASFVTRITLLIAVSIMAEELDNKSLFPPWPLWPTLSSFIVSLGGVSLVLLHHHHFPSLFELSFRSDCQIYPFRVVFLNRGAVMSLLAWTFVREKKKRKSQSFIPIFLNLWSLCLVLPGCFLAIFTHFCSVLCKEFFQFETLSLSLTTTFLCWPCCIK